MLTKEQKAFRGKLRRIHRRIELLQNEAYAIELASGLDLEGRMNDANCDVADLIEYLDMKEKETNRHGTD